MPAPAAGQPSSGVWPLSPSARLTLAGVQEWWRPDLRDSEYGHKLNLLRRQTVADNRPLLLALGSSRTVNGLRPDVLPPDGPRVFNFGLLGHGPVRQALTLDRLLRDGVRPKWLAVECPVLFLPLGTRELDTVPAANLCWADVHSLRDNQFRSAACSLDWLEARAAPAYASRFVLMSRLLATWLPWNLRQTSSAGEPPRTAGPGCRRTRRRQPSGPRCVTASPLPWPTIESPRKPPTAWGSSWTVAVPSESRQLCC